MLRFLAFVVLLALVGGGLYYWKAGDQRVRPPESLGEVGRQLRDAKTTAAVKGAIGLNRHLRPHSIEVETEDGVVALRGRIPTDELSRLAEEVTAAVPDVRQVVNHLRVSGEPPPPPPGSDRSLGESLDDGAVEVQVRLAFSLDRRLKGTDVQVSAFRRAVTLSGEVADDGQRRVAVRIARDTGGVESVEDRIRLKGEVEARQAGGGDAAHVERALAANPNLAAYGIEVAQEGGRLVLRGRVRTGAEKDLAGLVAQGAAGSPVENRLEIRP